MVISDIAGAYRFQHYILSTNKDTDPITAAAHRSLNIAGPIFSVDILQIDNQQLRIIRNAEEITGNHKFYTLSYPLAR